MALSISLCGIILSIYLMVSIFILTKRPITMPILAFIIGVTFFVFILSFASLLMNISFIKKKRHSRTTNFVGLWVSSFSLFFCLLITVFLILIRQRWIVFDYRFISDNRALMNLLFIRFQSFLQ